MSTYSAGIIGTGGIAGMGILGLHDPDKIGEEKFTSSHAGGYDATDGIELVAAADIDEDKLDQFGEAWDIPVGRRYRGHEAMLQNEDLDVVSVCTPSYLHRQHTLDAARSSADPDAIWCEKPVAASVAGAEEMGAVGEETETEIVVNHSLRFTEPVQRLRELVCDGLIGEVRAIHARFRRELMRNSTHLLDLLNYLFDARAVRVSGYINGENDAVTTLDADRQVDDSGGGGFVTLTDGSFVTIDCTVAREISSMELAMVGTDGKLRLNNDDEEWQYWALDGGTHIEKPMPGLEDAWSWDYDYIESFPNATEHIVDLLEGRADNQSPVEAATKSLEIIVGFYVSHYTGGHVSIPLDRPLRDITITSW